MIRTFFAAAIASLLLAGPSLAATAILDFDAQPSGTVTAAGSSITEDGYTISTISGGTFATEVSGDRGIALWVGFKAAVEIGDTLEIARTDGAAFTLDAFDYASNFDAISDGVGIFGLSSGGVVGSLPDFSSPSTAFFQVVDPFGGASFDLMRLVGSSVGAASLKFDNIALTSVTAPVPLPGGAVLLIGALGLLASRRRAART